MPHIPAAVLARQVVLEGLPLRHRGKVRDSYNLPDYPHLMLVVASDRISVFDHVLNAEVRKKGEILTAMNHFWNTEILGDICETDLVACGADIDEYLPEHLRNDPQLQKRATVVRITEAPDVEDIVRIHVAGTGWKSYQETGKICGHDLPPGLFEGSLLPQPLYTPTTKAAVGHDVHISAQSVHEKYGSERERLALAVTAAMSKYATSRGITLLDTKLEFGILDGEFVLVDERGTPDSSRFADSVALTKALNKRQSTPSLDKQFVRDWGKSVGIDNKLSPENPADVELVDSKEVPKSVLDTTTRIYRYIFWRLTGMQIEEYQRTKMGIDVPACRREIHILVGSKSDLPQIDTSMEMFNGVADCNVHIVSCHRNPAQLANLVSNRLVHADVVIAGAGMAAALPGIVKSLLCNCGHPEIPVIGVAFKGADEIDNLAATLSIERLPEQPVELDPEGNAYFGEEGFFAACCASLKHEFQPKMLSAKPAETDNIMIT